MKLAVNIKASLQSVHQAGHSPFKIVGETEATFTREGKPQQFKGSWLTEKLDVEILAGISFMEGNKSTIRPALWQVTIGNSTYNIGLPKWARVTRLFVKPLSHASSTANRHIRYQFLQIQRMH